MHVIKYIVNDSFMQVWIFLTMFNKNGINCSSSETSDFSLVTYSAIEKYDFLRKKINRRFVCSLQLHLFDQNTVILWNFIVI